MKNANRLLSFLLIFVIFLTACGPNGGGKDKVSPFPSGAFAEAGDRSVVGSIAQTGDGNAYVRGSLPAARGRAITFLSSLLAAEERPPENRHLVTLEHHFGNGCYVSGYLGGSLYVIQDFGSLAWNRKGVGHKDGSILLEYGEDGYFSISSMRENAIVVGNPTDPTVTSLWDDTSSYAFGYMVYDEAQRALRPLYAEDNLRFYTAGYFIDGVAQVSVKKDGRILFGLIDTRGNYIVEPKYEMMADERVHDVVIVAERAERDSADESYGDTCGRAIHYDSTLMTNVQFTRNYACHSQSVGLLNALTGELVLPCEYEYIERVTDDIYFLIDGADQAMTRYLYDVSEKSLTPVAEGVYSYFNADWMLYIKNRDTAYLADQSLTLYETTGLDVSAHAYVTCDNAERLINTNIVSAQRDEAARIAYQSKQAQVISEEYELERQVYTLTVIPTGDLLQDVISYTPPFDGGFLYTKANSLYRYDLASGASARVETGYGNYTEDHDRQGAVYYASLGELGEGVYTLRYNLRYPDNTSMYHLIIVNDKGAVLFETSVNAVEPLTKNYLGEYDTALYSLAGSTELEDNYFLTRDDGSHFLLQFVRGEEGVGGEGDADTLRTTRTIDCHMTFSLLSPFDLTDLIGDGELTVSAGGQTVPAEYYVYDGEARSLKLLSRIFDYDFSLMEALQNDRFLEITVTAGGKSTVLRIEVSLLAYRL